MSLVSRGLIAVTLCAAAATPEALAGDATRPTMDFNRDIRPILSNNCFQCHGPDENERQAGLRLDTRDGATSELDSGSKAIMPGTTGESELIVRVTSGDPSVAMPPSETGKTLSPGEIELLKAWVEQGAPYATHWSYVAPVRPALPEVRDIGWPANGIDRFILAPLEREGLLPSPATDRHALIRRLSLDMTGLPPTVAEVEEFVNDARPNAYELLVDRLLAKESYGEHWARMWLDLARYADSSGYADDPPRDIWAYRDYVIRALNANVPFDRLTVEQIAGDLLPNPTEDQLIATAFHRNTQTNNEGGTNDEEFRNVAVVDRVNTTMAVWMGTTMACAQCHTHKFDPLSQEEYFRFLAFFNNTEDADRRDENPTLPVYTEEQLRQKAEWQTEIASLEQTLRTPTPELLAAQARWESRFAADLAWQPLRPAAVRSQGGAATSLLDDSSVLVTAGQKTDTYTLELPAPEGRITALRLEALTHESLPGQGPGHAGGNFVLSKLTASLRPPDGQRLAGRYVRIEMPGPQKILSLAEVQVMSGPDNVAARGEATQSSTDYEGPAKLAIDGNTNGDYAVKSTTHTAISDNPWWEVDLKSAQPVDRIVVWNRTDNGLQSRLTGFRVVLLGEQRDVLWERTVAEPPNPSGEFSLSGERPVPLVAAYADYSQPSFEAANVIDNKDPANKGWAVGGATGQPHTLTLITAAPVDAVAGARLTVTVDQQSKHENHTLGRLRISATGDERATDVARTPAPILAILKTPREQRTEAQRADLAAHFLKNVAPELQAARDRLVQLDQQLAALKPATTVPIFRELPEGQRRKTQIQFRGNFLDLGPEVTAGVPAAFPPLPDGAPADRLSLARWLVSAENPLTARVAVNRYWEKIFGIGIVATSEEFGSQGEPPSHPELLDWLAVEFRESGWDVKKLLKLIVMSSAYRQSSRVTPELMERDPENRLLARGPRFRLPAETIRDQALFVSGLLSPVMYGPPVKPPQPSSGLSAAFGGGIDWQTSEGPDRYRRGLYTTWRRSNPYPSMATFDAPNREVCTVRRARTNTPLQALVTLNDPVYVECAQALARRMATEGGTTPVERARYGFRVCLSREPGEAELSRLVNLYERARERFQQAPSDAQKLATDPLGVLPGGTDAIDVAAWTVVGNVLLNLDEMFMTR